MIYGLRVDVLTSYQDSPGILLVSMLTILAIIGKLFDYLGFGLVNAYVSRTSVTGLAQSLLAFALTVQFYFLFRAFWEKAGTLYYQDNFENGEWNKLTLSNYGNDRQTNEQGVSAPVG